MSAPALRQIGTVRLERSGLTDQLWLSRVDQLGHVRTSGPARFIPLEDLPAINGVCPCCFKPTEAE